MKLNKTRSHLESSGELAAQFFGIHDTGALFNILRKQVYSNPILAICREVSCNARDAHREVGTPEIPVVIHLPNNFEPYYKIKDFGPGISPDRMNNVFIKYTASTKNDDNLQTGGFGLGAKTPFSYADSFSITTIHNGIKYYYNCVIDETQVGKLILTDQEKTSEKNGTEIMVPVMAKDFNYFRVYTEQACRHWEVKPTIENGEITWQEPKIVLSGDKWAVAMSSHGNQEARCIIDGIEYPLDLYSLKNYADTSLINAVNGQIVMYFGVGELTIAISRENIYLDDKTQNLVRARLDAITKELKQRAEAKMASIPTYWEANIYYNTELRASFNNIDFLGKLEWKGLPLIRNHFSTNTPTYSFTKGKHSRKYGLDPNKLSRSSDYYVRFDKNTVLYFNDLPLKEPTPRHVKKAFDEDSSLHKVYVICPSDKVDKDALFKGFHLEEMGIKMLSTITKATARAYTPPAARLLLFKFDSRAAAFRQVSYASVDEDKGEKILCTLKRRSDNGYRYAILKNGQELCYNSLRSLVRRYPNHSFYGVDETASADRIKEDFSDFTKAEDFITKEVLVNANMDFTKIKFANNYHSAFDNKMYSIHDSMKPRIKGPKSLYLECMELQKKLKDLASKMDIELLRLYESVNGPINESEFQTLLHKNPDLDVHKLKKAFNKKYPLLEHIDSWSYKDIVPQLADYVNLIDKG